MKKISKQNRNRLTDIENRMTVFREEREILSWNQYCARILCGSWTASQPHSPLRTQRHAALSALLYWQSPFVWTGGVIQICSVRSEANVIPSSSRHLFPHSAHRDLFLLLALARLQLLWRVVMSGMCNLIGLPLFLPSLLLMLQKRAPPVQV